MNNKKLSHLHATGLLALCLQPWAGAQASHAASEAQPHTQVDTLPAGMAGKHIQRFSPHWGLAHISFARSSTAGPTGINSTTGLPLVGIGFFTSL